MPDSMNTPEPIVNAEERTIVELALAEDRIACDITSQAAIPAGLVARAELLAKQAGVMCGLPVLDEVCRQVDPQLQVTWCTSDGSPVKPGQVVAVISGNARSILAAERTALNFVCHLSGIATLTARFVSEVKGTRAWITDTRKTTPGMRRLEKYAVRCGGGHNHRTDLADGVLVKDNHLALLDGSGENLLSIVGNIRHALARGTVVEVEVTSLTEAREAIAGGADILLLDNMSIDAMTDVVKTMGGKAVFEASGGIDLTNVREVAGCGVDRISIGALTHSARALDFSLEMTPL